MDADAAEEQRNELLALQVIYGADFIPSTSDPSSSGSIRVVLSLPQRTADGTECIHIRSENGLHTLYHIPPLSLHFSFPPTYPAVCPNLQLFHTTLQDDNTLPVKWFKREDITRLNGELQQQLKPGLPLMFDAVDILTLQWAKMLKVESELPIPNHIVRKLIAYENARSTTVFNDALFTCGICMTRLRGNLCYQFSTCGHVFCKQCLRNYYTVLINENIPRNVMLCPEPECVRLKVKGDEAAIECNESRSKAATSVETIENQLAILESSTIVTELKSIEFSNELIERWKTLLMQHEYEANPNMTWCPHPQCGGPARKERSDQYNKMATCLLCGFIFCHNCQRTWHGMQVFCQIANPSKLVLDYLAASDDAKRQLEIKYGKKFIDKAILDHRNYHASMKWMSDNAQSCPGCKTFVTKTFGCNHMTCNVCSPPTHFCNLCGIFLNRANPYSHFSDQTQGCYGRLMDGAIDDEENEAALIQVLDELF